MTNFYLLPDYGPLEIEDIDQFFKQSKANFEHTWNMRHESNANLKDFEFKRYINKGSFGKLILVQSNITKEYFAMKFIEKEELVNSGKINYAKNEKYMLQRLNFPFIVYLKYFFNDNSYLYFIMPFYSGRELLFHLDKMGKFNETLSRFVGAQIVLSLEYLHYLDIIFRDLKPENIIYDHTGYIKLVDFGFAKIVKTRTYTTCGTPVYMAPEIVYNKGYGKSVDWWALGVIIFEMTSGKTPFKSDTIMKCFNDKSKLKIPSYFSPELKDLVNNILQIDLTRRIGNLKDGVNDIKNHPWFRPILWMSLLNRKLNPPYIPIPTEMVPDGSIYSLDMSVSKSNKFLKEFENF